MLSFSTLCSHIANSWSDFYSTPEIPPNYYGVTHFGVYTGMIPTQFYVFHVTFTYITESHEMGGAIYIQSETKLLVESSSFIRCHSNTNGGAIYLYGSNCESALNMVCSTNTTGNCNHFCNIKTENTENSTNCMLHSSVADLNPPNEDWHNVGIDGGNIVLKYDNITKNRCDRWCGLNIGYSKRFSISYTSLENNTSSVSNGIFHFHYIDNTAEMYTCNIIGNNAVDDVYGVILMSNAKLDMSNTCMLENNIGKAVFCLENSGDTIMHTNCTFDNTKKLGSGTVTENSPSSGWNSSINKLYGLQYGKCIGMTPPRKFPRKCVFKTVPNRISMQDINILVIS